MTAEEPEAKKAEEERTKAKSAAAVTAQKTQEKSTAERAVVDARRAEVRTLRENARKATAAALEAERRAKLRSEARCRSIDEMNTLEAQLGTLSPRHPAPLSLRSIPIAVRRVVCAITDSYEVIRNGKTIALLNSTITADEPYRLLEYRANVRARLAEGVARKFRIDCDSLMFLRC